MSRAAGLNREPLPLLLAALLLLAAGCGGQDTANVKSEQPTDDLRGQVEQLKKELTLEKQARKEEQRRLAEESRKIKQSETENGRRSSAIAMGPRIAEIVECDSEKTVVRADGIGDDADAALREAFHRAVELAVGTMVDGSTLVQNEAVIEKILTHSAGFVKTYQTLSVVRAGGVCRQEIRAVVLRQALAERLTSSNVAVKNVDGKGLFAEAVTKLSAERDTVAMIREILDDYPASILKGVVASGPTIVSQTENAVKLSYDVRIEIDKARYQKMLDRLLPVLNRSATKHGLIRTMAYYDRDNRYFVTPFTGFGPGGLGPPPPITSFGNDSEKAHWEGIKPRVVCACRRFDGHDFDYWLKKINPDNRTTMVLVVAQPVDEEGLAVQWQWYILPAADVVGTLVGAHIEYQGTGERDIINFGFSR